MVASYARNSLTSKEIITKTTSGFIMAEVLLIIAAISVLATLLVIIINPAERSAQAANNQRQANLVIIRNALESYANDHNGQYPTTNGEYWCQDCTYDDYKMKGANNWIPKLVAEKYIEGLPRDIRPGSGTACYPYPDNSYAGYVYYSPPPPHNTDYKLFVFCTPPTSALNTGVNEATSPYCAVPSSYDSSNFNPRPAGQPQLKPFVDPARPTYAYAIYTPGLACL